MRILVLAGLSGQENRRGELNSTTVLPLILAA